MDGEDDAKPDRDAAARSSASPPLVSLHPPQEQEQHSRSSYALLPPPSRSSRTSKSPPPPKSASHLAPDRLAKSRRGSLPVSFPPLFFQPNASSTSLAPSTAEGKPIPLDDTTTAHRTSALQKLNSTYPSAVRRHRYTKSSGAQSSTYSQPVLVRTYSGPSTSQASHSSAQPPRYRPSSGSRSVSRRVPLPSSSTSAAGFSGRPAQPSLGGVGSSNSSSGQRSGNNGSSFDRVAMPRHKATKASSKLSLPLPLPLPWQWQSASSQPEPDEPKLPPLEAFSFKSFMADIQAQGGDNDIGSDLDRIAEICARSRYSLSNQYEVHVAPHGSGLSFTSGGAPVPRKKGHSHSYSHSRGGPTLQAITSDDDDSNSRSHRKRRSGARRRSVAYGTLETIMSSSRSSEEDKTKKKPAAELAEEVRGRAAKKAWGNSTGSGSGSGSGSTANAKAGSRGTTTEDSQDPGQSSKAKLARKKSALFATAIMDSGRSTISHHTSSSVRRPAAALVSDLAMPQTSTTNLGVRTTPEAVADSGFSRPGPSRSTQAVERLEVHFADEPPHQGGPRSSTGSLLGWSTWVPWGKGDTGAAGHSRDTPSYAEGSLRQLLRSADATVDKGKNLL
ncbi:hypothetical protein B0H63DRAFT_525020 [Podospora didyma]|uniref:Uncharacterized protein n=1 Tax=Podospora didyma TaxID=330526 RepID=A0AAE0KK42_9PEZI|nr:hypothetical protein B0H63DRAFT_525020 [Podospora didyma]